MDDWSADVDVDELPSGMFVPVLVLTPPAELGSPVRRVLDGEFAHPELARLAALDAFIAMTHSDDV